MTEDDDGGRSRRKMRTADDEHNEQAWWFLLRSGISHCVPHFEFEMDDDEYPMPTASWLPRQKPSVPEDDIMELLWQNDQVVMQSHNQWPQRKPLT
ncbi:hypothetical protein K1719_023040 [Acacia pycnantha]|nr:hypothetical protein K1719_023040 [Acacia pycnantha]